MASRNGDGSTPYVRIAYVGGGSRGWAHTLMTDLALCSHLTGEVRLYDIDRPMALLNARWGRRVCQSPDARSAWRFTVPKTLAQALRDADFVVASIQPGPIELMAHDLGIPARYGIVHPVGDTVGPAGLCRCLRAVPQYAAIARAVARHCPDAWVITYTNPMSVCTRTLYKVFPRVKAFGCCHTVFSAKERLAELLRQHHGVRAGPHEIRMNVLGVNHFTWADRARYKDIDLIALYDRHWRRKGMVRRYTAEELAAQGRWFFPGQVGHDMFRRYGVFPAITGRHLVEFVPFYVKDVDTLTGWGVQMSSVQRRIRRYHEAPRRFRKRLASSEPFRLKHSTEEAVEQMTALLDLGDLHTNVNLPNVGQIENLPRGAIVETNAFFTADSVKPEHSGHLPAGVGAWVARAVSNQEMIVQAALDRDKGLAFQAFLNDPLTTLTTDRAWKMFNEMLKATRSMLPGWKI